MKRDYQDIVAALDAQINDRVVLVKGSDLRPQPVRWLWQYWLALGKLHILAGAPGQGQTTIALAMAATVTIGGRWPDGTRCHSIKTMADLYGRPARMGCDADGNPINPEHPWNEKSR